ncbi:hypothetical protein H5410_031306 [Solanum commersonii]|uniref:Uncharacterized protein n=1 Tax=Solanum commersonii TaxID=4109 RepID=A0A9J5YJT7_SOLCO|nr:hypothetical protein H5410_031306 [Solanum commersonii]
MCLVVDLPIHGAQLHPSQKDGSTNDQEQKGDPKEVLEEKSKTEATEEKEVATKQKAQVEENIRVLSNSSSNKRDQIGMDSYQCSVYSRSPGIRLTVDMLIHKAQLHPPLRLNKNGSTDNQAPNGEPNEVFKEKAKKEAAKEREVVVAEKQQKQVQIQENIQIMDQRLRCAFGDGSRTYTPHKRLCDVFGDPSQTSRRIRTANVVATVKLEEGIGDNIIDEQQSQVGEALDACAE